MTIDREELIQEIGKHAADVLKNSGNPAERLQACFILHQIEDGNVREEQAREMMERIIPELAGKESGESREIRRDLMAQLYDANLTIRDMARGAMAHYKSGKNSQGILEGILEVLASAGEPSSECSIADANWKAVHACRMRAPILIHIHADRLSQIDIDTRCRKWARIDIDGKISLSGEGSATGFEFADDKVAAVYRFDNPEGHDGATQSASLVWERRFLYTAQMTQEQLAELKERSK